MHESGLGITGSHLFATPTKLAFPKMERAQGQKQVCVLGMRHRGLVELPAQGSCASEGQTCQGRLAAVTRNGAEEP